ncbi:hypothetical protein GBA52_014254 [Prunus armeniaca]|nr:hypothetical protein GBA52_014254 [Prunus armeniaca]
MGEKLTTRVREQLLEKLMTFEIGWYDQDENTSAAICARFSHRSKHGSISCWGQDVIAGPSSFRGYLCLCSRTCADMEASPCDDSSAANSHWELLCKEYLNEEYGRKKPEKLKSKEANWQAKLTTLKGPKKESIKQSYVSGAGLFSSQFFNTAATALAYWYGGRLLVLEEITPKHLFQAFLILLFTAYIIAEAGSMTSDISKGNSAIQSVFAILDRKSEIDPDNKWGLEIKRRIKGRVEFRNVFFSYPTRPDQMILKGLSLRIDAGKTVALVGQSGSGKSTIIGLIERFYDPMKGSVCIDEQDIKNYNLRMLRSHIALVSQEPTLFAGTVRENIAYGKENAKESDIKRAAVLANAHEFIRYEITADKLHTKKITLICSFTICQHFCLFLNFAVEWIMVYDTYCGERGVQLSGGQKQRIAIARAILKKPSILLLDEATSALDSVSEKAVQEALEKMMVSRTCIVIAHRLSTIQKANSIAVIKNGKVAEQGSHNELISLGRNGAYYSLIKLQTGNSPPR